MIFVCAMSYSNYKPLMINSAAYTRKSLQQEVLQHSKKIYKANSTVVIRLEDSLSWSSGPISC